LAAFSAGQKLTAAALIAILPVPAIKTADESLASSTTLQNDNELVCVGAANTNYKVDLALLATEATGTGIDIKLAFTQPTGCVLDLAVVAPHLGWVSSAGAQLEVEWAGWQAETGTTTSAKSFGTLNGVNFSYHFRGTWRVGSTAGSLQLQWAQNTSAGGNLTVKSGSSLIITPLLT
jgi:hypothetical protein